MSVRSYRRVSTSLSPALFGLAFLAAGCGETATAGDTCDGGACNPPPAERDISIGIDPPRQDLGVPPTTPEGDGGVETDALLLIDGSLPPDAFRPPATCETRNDGVCDEPSSGGVLSVKAPSGGSVDFVYRRGSREWKETCILGAVQEPQGGGGGR